MVVYMVFMDLNLTYIQYSGNCLKFYLFGCGLKILAFILWNIDNVFCSSIAGFRSLLPTFLSPGTTNTIKLFCHNWFLYKLRLFLKHLSNELAICKYIFGIRQIFSAPNIEFALQFYSSTAGGTCWRATPPTCTSYFAFIIDRSTSTRRIPSSHKSGLV